MLKRHSFKKCVFTFASPNSCWRKTETSLGTRDHKLADKWIPAMCRNPPLCAESPPSQTEVIPMDSEVKGNPNPHVPLTQASRSNTADAWWELCYTNRSSGTGGWREMGRKKRGKTATDGAKSNTIVLFLSPSASLTSCCISRGWESEYQILHLDQVSAFSTGGRWASCLFGF